MSKTKAQLEDELKALQEKLVQAKKMEDHWYHKHQEALDELSYFYKLEGEHSQVVKQRDRMMQNIHDMDKRYHSLLRAFRDLATEVLTPRGMK